MSKSGPENTKGDSPISCYQHPHCSLWYLPHLWYSLCNLCNIILLINHYILITTICLSIPLVAFCWSLGSFCLCPPRHSMLCSLISDVYTLLLSHCSVSVSLLLYALWDLYTILSLLSILTMVLSVYTLYSMVLLFSLLFSVSIRYTLWFFCSHYYSQFEIDQV